MSAIVTRSYAITANSYNTVATIERRVSSESKKGSSGLYLRYSDREAAFSKSIPAPIQSRSLHQRQRARSRDQKKNSRSIINYSSHHDEERAHG
jgi:hypothetical protein